MWLTLKKSDYSEATNYLQKHSPFTCPMYGNVVSAGFSYKPVSMRSGLYYVYKADKKIRGIIAGYNDGNVMIHTECEEARKDSIKIISLFPFHSVWGLDGHLPDNKVLSKTVKMELDRRELSVMVLKERITDGCKDNNEKDIEFVRIDKKFIKPAVILFVKKCLWEGFGFSSNTYDIKKRIRERTEHEPYWLLLNKGKYVSQAHVQAMTDRHGYIGGVCTPRQDRRKGYAKIVMDFVCEYIFCEGRTPALAVSLSNIAACELYNGMGFETIGTTVVYMQERSFKGDENS